MRDFVWGEKRVLDLVDGGHWEVLGSRRSFVLSDSPSYYEQRCRALDMGIPELALDAIQLDMAVDRLFDMPAKAALQLRMLGWDEADIGSVVRDRRRRTGAGLVESGVRGVVRGERRRAGR